MEWIDIGIEANWQTALIKAIHHGGYIPSAYQASKIKENFEFWTCETLKSATNAAITSKSIASKMDKMRVIIVKDPCPTLKGNISYATGDTHNQ
jgi:hypothetical protein